MGAKFHRLKSPQKTPVHGSLLHDGSIVPQALGRDAEILVSFTVVLLSRLLKTCYNRKALLSTQQRPNAFRAAIRIGYLLRGVAILWVLSLATTMLQLWRAAAISAIVAQIRDPVANGAIITPIPSLNIKTNGANDTLLGRPDVGAPGEYDRLLTPLTFNSRLAKFYSLSFPPGPKPPRDPWPVGLHYADLDTPTLIVFSEFSDVESRNERQLKLILEKAISQCGPSQIRNHLVQPLQVYEWSQTVDDVTILLTITAADDAPSRYPPHELVGLTYNVWTNCLIAINRFRLAYPGVYFSYDIYIDAGGYKHLFVGYGKVSTEPGPGTPGLQATAPGENNTNRVATT